MLDSTTVIRYVTPDLLTEVLALVPDVWLASDTAFASPDAARSAYLEFLLARMEQRVDADRLRAEHASTVWRTGVRLHGYAAATPPREGG